MSTNEDKRLLKLPAGYVIGRKGPLATQPDPTTSPGATFFATDPGLPQLVRLRRSDGVRWHVDVPTFNVLTFGADPTGATPSDEAFAAAIYAAAFESSDAVSGRFGRRVHVPAGLYRFERPLDVYGGVTLYGEGATTNSSARLHIGPESCIRLHSQGSAPHYTPSGGGYLDGIDIRAERPVFAQKGWRPSTAYAVGTKVRVPGDNRGYWHCVQAGISGSTPPPTPGLPELSRVWTPGNTVGYHAVRRATNGRRDVCFVSNDSGKTGETEPAWSFTPGQTTSDHQVTWTARVPGSTWFDGTCVWEARAHSIVMLGGSIEHFAIDGFANFGIVGWGDVSYMPHTNLNNWYVGQGVIANCGGGVTFHGGDANRGLCSRVTAIQIGYELDGSTPIPYTGQRVDSGGHGFWDDSFFGNTWIACVAETCEGRGLYDRQSPFGSTWLGCYAENTAPLFLARATGNSLANTSGWDVGGQGAIVLGGGAGAEADSWKFRPVGFTWPHGLWARTNWRDLPGFWILGDAQSEIDGEYWGWHKRADGPDAHVWTLCSLPRSNLRVLGMQHFDAPEGPGLREFGITFHGMPGSDYFVCTLSTAELEGYPERVRRGQRLVGDRFEPPGGFHAVGSRYVGKMCVTAGWDGLPWSAGMNVRIASSLQAANVVDPGNGFIYQSQTAGRSPGPVVWPVSIGAEVTDGDVVWRNVGPRAVYQYYGTCV